MKRTRSFIAFAGSFLIAAIMVATSPTGADAHKRHYGHNHGGLTLGFGSHGVFGGVIVGKRGLGRRSHCHGRNYCHRHKNRGYHSHNNGGVKLYPRHTAPRYRRGGYSAHVQWCINRYKTYDLHTDTFQPYKGRRKHCNSPY